MPKNKEKGEEIRIEDKLHEWSHRTLKELIMLQQGIIEMLAREHIYCEPAGLQERKDGVVKITLNIYPPEVLKEKGIQK